MKVGRLNSSQDGIIFSIDGEVQTLSAGHGNVPKILINEPLHDTIQSGHDTDNKIGGGNSLTKKHCWDMIKVKSATKSGFEEAKEGDSINFSMPNSETRRGRVGVGVAQTLDTQVNQSVIVAQRGRENGQQLEPNTTNTLTSVQKDNLVLNNYRIRRLTEVEVERLQGFPDNWTMWGNYNGEIKKISKTQRYKMCGNAVTTSIVALIGKKLLQLP